MSLKPQPSPHSSTFLDEVLEVLCDHPLYHARKLDRLAVVLPSHRAMSRLRTALIARLNEPARLPKFCVLSGFIEDLSPWKTAEPLEVIARLFGMLKEEGEEVDFDRFVPWATVVLSDFSAVDHELKDVDEVFRNLADIQGIEDWSFGEEPWSEDQKKFDRQWRALPGRYRALNASLARDGLATKAQITRHVAELGQTDGYDHVLVAGLATMSTAEWAVFKHWQKAGKLTTIWDGDASYVDDPHNEAGRFIRLFRGTSPFPRQRIAENPPAVKVVTCQSMVSQTQYVRDVVEGLDEAERSRTLVVLPDGSSLGTLLQALPSSEHGYNVTMGLALHETPVQSWVDKLFGVLDATTGAWKFDHLRDLHAHAVMRAIHSEEAARTNDHQAFHELARTHRAWVKATDFEALEASSWADIVRGLDDLKGDNAEAFLTSFSAWAEAVEPLLGEPLPNVHGALVKPSASPWILAGWSRLRVVLSMVQRLQNAHQPMESAREARTIIRKLLRQERIDLLGEPDAGLQIMGLSETRALDYDRVLVLDMNEGIVPQTSMPDSFLPLDLRNSLNMPGRREREARFAYLVHRLMNRASEVHFLTRQSHDGHEVTEASRYLLQFDGSFHNAEGSPFLTVERLSHQLPLPGSRPSIPDLVMTKNMRDTLDAWAAKGMSPSAINKMVICPREFAFRYLFKMGESADMETSMEANTLGSVVHHVMEHGLSDAVGKLVSTSHLDAIADQIEDLLANALKAEYNSALVERGENVLKLEIARSTILSLVRQERKELVQGEPIPFLNGVESVMTANVHHPKGGDMAFYGKMDRMETVVGQTRLVDYKSGRVVDKDLALSGDLADQLSSGKHNKALQLLVYASIVLANMDPLERERGVLAAIRSGKNVRAGLLSLVIDGEQVIQEAHMNAFLDWLADQLETFRTPQHPLAHNPESHYCEHCVVLDPKPNHSY